MSRVPRALTLAATGSELTDGQLLEAYAANRDGAVFAELVRRHGPMVWGVCRRFLHNRQDAEDAFQATFLVLVRKPGSVRPPDRVGNWLHGVAIRVARKAGRGVARRRERQVESVPEIAAGSESVWRELVPLVDREIARLPDKYRLPVVLCDLEGATRQEAAKRLGWPEGTVAGRLVRAREMLARRLERYRLSVSGAALIAVLSGRELSAVAPAGLFDSTIQAAVSGSFSAEAAALAKGVIRAMFTTKLMTLAVVASAAVLLGGVLLRAQPASAPSDPPKNPLKATPAEAKGVPAPPAPPKIPKELLEKRAEAARKVYQANMNRFKAGQALPSELFGWSERWMEAELALVEKPADRAKVLQAHLARTRDVERIAIGYAKTGQGRQADADAATYYRLEAEIRLNQEGVPVPEEQKTEKK